MIPNMYTITKQLSCISFMLLLVSCSDDLALIKPERKTLVEFSVQGTEELWQANKIQIVKGPPVVKLIGSPTQAHTFNRFFLIAEGESPNKESFVLVITFDAADQNEMRHRYTTTYDTQGGLNQITLITQTNGEYTASELCTESISAFEIKRQSRDEKLLSGEFSGELCLPGVATVTLLEWATFRDVKY